MSRGERRLKSCLKSFLVPALFIAHRDFGLYLLSLKLDF